MSKVKKLLTLDELAKFCLDNEMGTFSSKDTGYTLSVQVPGTMNFAEKQSNTLLYTTVKVCHTQLNRNNSYISEENMKKAMPTLKNQPLLASIIEDENGELDFNGHDMKVIDHEDGTKEIEYIERQVGSFDSTFEPYLEYDKENDKTYVIAMAAIPREYTPVADIIERKNGTKVSCELAIYEMAVNAKEKYIELIDFEFSGVTCLGEHVAEGMQGSRLDITDFSTENNAVRFEKDDKLIEVLEKLNNTLSNFNIDLADTKDSKEGGTDVTKFEELLSKYNKNLEDITFEYEGLTDEELETAFAEAFGNAEPEGESVGDTDAVVVEENAEESNVDEVAEVVEAEAEEEPEAIQNSLQFTVNINGTTKTYSVSINEKLEAMFNLINETYSELDNDIYDVNVYEEDKVVEMYGWFNGRNYRQSYKTKKDSFSLVGDRVEIYKKYLSQDEINELEAFKAKFAELEQYKAAKEFEIAHAERMSALADYSSIEKTDEYKKLVKDIDQYSKEEIIEKADAIVGKYARQGMQFNFVEETDKAKFTKVVGFVTKDVPEASSYSGLFD